MGRDIENKNKMDNNNDKDSNNEKFYVHNKRVLYYYNYIKEKPKVYNKVSGSLPKDVQRFTINNYKTFSTWEQRERKDSVAKLQTTLSNLVQDSSEAEKCLKLSEKRLRQYHVQKMKEGVSLKIVLVELRIDKK